MKDQPIIDFIQIYNERGTVRMHMPGHKGGSYVRQNGRTYVLHKDVTEGLTGAEALDITEIKGADALYEAEGIIGESERIMSELYGSARTLYSTEGSSLSIKAMLACVKELYGSRLKIAAARNCHRAFVNGCILLDIQPVWIFPKAGSSQLCRTAVTPRDIERVLTEDGDINAVYLTSPDYLGNMADIRAAAEICHRHGALLLIDNAHGAYLKFAGEGLHPLELGADMCTDSAHKTLPALTGASLLHISNGAPEKLTEIAKSAMLLFASTSPSYVIMSSLDKCAHELSGDLPQRIKLCCKTVGELKQELTQAGFEILSSEPMKLTVGAYGLGWDGIRLGEYLRVKGIEPEYCDPDCVVLMPSPYNTEEELEWVKTALLLLPALPRLPEQEPCPVPVPVQRMTMREAYFSPHERISADNAAVRVCSRAALCCQPSVPVIFGGEVFDENTIKFLKRYGILEVDVL